MIALCAQLEAVTIFPHFKKMQMIIGGSISIAMEESISNAQHAARSLR